MARASKLRLLDLTINKHYSTSDSRLAAGSGVAVAIHRQGASAAEAKTVATTNTTLAIRDPGALRIGDIVQLNTSTSTTMSVVSIASRTQVTLASLTGAGIAVVSGDRLIPTVKPTLYTDATGAATTSNPLTSDAVGYAKAYIYEQAVDYILSGSGLTSTLYQDFRTGAIDLHFNVVDYSAVGDGVTDDEPALNRLFDLVSQLAPDEGISTVFFPRGIYAVKTPLVPDGENVTGAVVGLHIEGEAGARIKAVTTASGGTWTATIRTALLSFKNTTAANQNWVIEGLELDGSQVGAIGGATALMGLYTSTITNLTVRDCYFHDFGDPALGSASSPRNDGILLGDDISDTDRGAAIDVKIDNCRFVNCVRNGISMLDCEGVRIGKCTFDNCDNCGVDIEPNFAFQSMLNVTIQDCTFAQIAVYGIVCTPGSGIQGVLYDDQMESLKIRDCYMDGEDVCESGILVQNWKDVDIHDCTLSRLTTTGIQVDSSQDVQVHANTVTDMTIVAASTGIYILSSKTVQSKSCKVDNNIVNTCQGYGIRLIDVDGGSCQGNVVDDCDNAAGARSNITVERTGATLVCRYITVQGNTSTNSNSGYGIKFVDSGANHVVSCTCAYNICLSNGAGQILMGADTTLLQGPNITGALTGYAIPPPYAAGTAGTWVGTFTCTPGVKRTVVSNVTILNSATRIMCTPRTARAAMLASAFWVSGVTGGKFSASHASASAGGFAYTIFNS